MIPFTESLRYEYLLTPESVVIDAGGYEGNFAATIAQKYGCRVEVYEPIKEFYENIKKRFAGSPLEHLIHVHHAGIGASSRKEIFGVKGDQTGIVCSGNYTEEVQIIPVQAVVMAHAPIALMKLNIEGCEFEVMEALLDAGMMSQIEHLQVQNHNIIPNAESRWASIRNRMLITHKITWEAPWCWTGFSSK